MTRRAAKVSAIASSSTRHTLSDVPIGHRARLIDGSIVLVATHIAGAIFVRDNDGVGNGPYELPRSTVVLEVIAPRARYESTRAAVADPLAGMSSKGARR